MKRYISTSVNEGMRAYYDLYCDTLNELAERAGWEIKCDYVELSNRCYVFNMHVLSVPVSWEYHISNITSVSRIWIQAPWDPPVIQVRVTYAYYLDGRNDSEEMVDTLTHEFNQAVNRVNEAAGDD